MGPLPSGEEMLVGLSAALCPTALTGDMEKWHQVGWDTQTQPAARQGEEGTLTAGCLGRRSVMKSNIAECKVMHEGKREPQRALNTL